MKTLLIKLRSLLYAVPLDKQLHSYYGNLTFKLAFLLILFLVPGNLRFWESILLIGIFNGLIVGFAKEYLDVKTGNKFDFKDILATLVGSVLESFYFGLTVYILINFIKIKIQ